jgi:hypothetical protein
MFSGCCRWSRGNKYGDWGQAGARRLRDIHDSRGKMMQRYMVQEGK